jgi:hypothetical protein
MHWAYLLEFGRFSNLACRNLEVLSFSLLYSFQSFFASKQCFPRAVVQVPEILIFSESAADHLSTKPKLNWKEGRKEGRGQGMETTASSFNVMYYRHAGIR